MSRGNASLEIFRDNTDRRKFLYWLEDAVNLHNLICHAYCLMGNHYHLLIETPDANLAKAMRDINGHYTQWFNARHKRAGHLFQGRYKSFVIEKEAYLLEVARYIVINPVRANLVLHPREWQWSSYQFTAGVRDTPDWLHIDWILKLFNDDKQNAQALYRKYVKEGIGVDDPHETASNGFLLGSPEFVHFIWESYTNGSEDVKEYSRDQRVVGRPTLAEIFSDIGDKQERDDAIKFARFRCGYLASEIARYIGLEPSVVGRISRGKYNVKPINNKKITKIIRESVKKVESQT